MIPSFGILMSGVPAVYGRYNTADISALWGFNVNGRAAWVLQELPNLVAAALCWRYRSAECAASPANLILLALFVAHYCNRTLVFPFLLRGGKDTPVSVFAFAAIFCSLNGYIQSRWLCTLHAYPADWHLAPQFLLGCAVFAAGAFANNQADYILRNLRKPGDTGYYIPKGGLFTFVSGANFCGEIVEWIGFAIASNSWAGAAFAAATFLNTAPRGCQHHEWYLNKFGEEYRALGRRAVIPFLW